jgi:hypothetical protein
LLTRISLALAPGGTQATASGSRTRPSTRSGTRGRRRRRRRAAAAAAAAWAAATDSVSRIEAGKRRRRRGGSLPGQSSHGTSTPIHWQAACRSRARVAGAGRPPPRRRRRPPVGRAAARPGQRPGSDTESRPGPRCSGSDSVTPSHSVAADGTRATSTSTPAARALRAEPGPRRPTRTSRSPTVLGPGLSPTVTVTVTVCPTRRRSLSLTVSVCPGSGSGRARAALAASGGCGGRRPQPRLSVAARQARAPGRPSESSWC